ncbi:hypothetical protein FIBSPDRAFT_95129 [Athelia psychrophila]|uniref:Uncharacterized protein n=1 Tax=Athelia psychrophila TaxID=1759441 RepID=A0A166TQD5_9AGAM|nr:hypothetical protein FIBSPDRAFT_95129 [Fibularhizoctonia sp. CBS 109695]
MKWMVAVWPTIWIWIRLLNERAIHVRETSSLLSEPQSAADHCIHPTLVNSVLFFLGYNGKQSVLDELITAVNGTDGVWQMMVTWWIEEARDERGAMGFYACAIDPEFERLATASCGGSTKEVAKIAFNRIAHNFHWLRLHVPALARENEIMYSSLGRDFAFVITIFKWPSSALYQDLRAHPGWVKLLTDISFHFLAPPHSPMKRDAIGVTMTVLLAYISRAPFYEELVELLESRFLDVISRRDAVSGQDLKDDCDYLINRIRMFLVYRSIMRKTERCLRAIEGSIWMKASNAPVATIFLDLRESSKFTVEAYNDFRGGPPPIFCCGNKEVRRPCFIRGL